MSCREKIEELHRLCCELHAATSSHVVDAFRFDRGRSEKQVNKAMRLLVGAVAARDPEDCLQALKQFPIEEIESAALAPNPAEWKREMVRAGEMLVNYGIRLSSDKRSGTSAELAVGCNDLLHAIQRATVEETQTTNGEIPKTANTDPPPVSSDSLTSQQSKLLQYLDARQGRRISFDDLPREAFRDRNCVMDEAIVRALKRLRSALDGSNQIVELTIHETDRTLVYQRITSP